MPYKREGVKIYTKKEGKWKLKQTTGSVAKAEGALRLLRGLESGDIKPKDVGKGKYSKIKRKRSKSSVKHK